MQKKKKKNDVPTWNTFVKSIAKTSAEDSYV